MFRLAGSQYVALQRDAQGWLASDVLGVRFTRLEGPPPRLRIDDGFGFIGHGPDLSWKPPSELEAPRR